MATGDPGAPGLTAGDIRQRARGARVDSRLDRDLDAVPHDVAAVLRSIGIERGPEGLFRMGSLHDPSPTDARTERVYIVAEVLVDGTFAWSLRTSATAAFAWLRDARSRGATVGVAKMSLRWGAPASAGAAVARLDPGS